MVQYIMVYNLKVCIIHNIYNPRNGSKRRAWNASPQAAIPTRDFVRAGCNINENYGRGTAKKVIQLLILILDV